jgi:hypothetical protein
VKGLAGAFFQGVVMGAGAVAGALAAAAVTSRLDIGPRPPGPRDAASASAPHLHIVVAADEPEVAAGE